MIKAVTTIDSLDPARLRGLLLDAAGTLLTPTEPIATVYGRHARAFGGSRSARQVATSFREAMADPALRAARLEEPSWHQFWREVVRRSTGVDDPALLDALYQHYERPTAWRVAADAQACCEAARARGIQVAVVSNWDTRLRPLLEALEVTRWIDAAVISGEFGREKPDPKIFHHACQRLAIAPARALHIGDSQRADVEGARAAGCHALRFGVDVGSFSELARRLGLA